MRIDTSGQEQGVGVWATNSNIRKTGSSCATAGTSCFLSLFLFVISGIFFSWIPFSGSVSMKSLSCYNDYSSHVTCKWKEHKEAHDLLRITLYQNDSMQK